LGKSFASRLKPEPKRERRGIAQKQGEIARIKHPTEPFTYYCSLTASWVQHGYTRFSRTEQQARFGALDENNRDHDGRQWEFFGTVIPLYDPEEQT
jgi:hypothetical protein